MFQTLKAQNRTTGDSEYIIHSSIAASEIIKTKKHPACTRCKLKKLKCILSADDGCEKCLERGARCSYTDLTSTTDRSESTPDDSGECGSSTSQVTNLQMNGMAHSSADDTTLLSSPITCRPQDSAPQSGNESLSSSGPENHTPEISHLTTSDSHDDPYSIFMDTASDFAAWTPTLPPELQMVSDSISDPPFLLQDSRCACSESLIAANAEMQVKMIWGVHLSRCNASSIDDMLQCQKKVLISSETLLGCSKCSLRAEFVILVLSMCREMVNGILAATKIMQSTSTQRSDITKFSFGSGTERTGIQGWQLFDDEELEMIKTLMDIRVKKLKKLLGQLEQIVNSNHKPYSWMVSMLQETLEFRDTEDASR